MQKYYFAHEYIYRKLDLEGKLSWDGAKSIPEIMEHSMNDRLAQCLDQDSMDPSQTHVLDLGCGTGTTTLFLAKKGYQVTGIDLSAKALEMAQRLASHMELDINFVCQDLVTYQPTQKFDLVVDSSCLHCLVDDEDRQAFFGLIKKALKPEGRVFIHTMVQSKDMSDVSSQAHLSIEGDVIWSTGGTNLATDERFRHRRILESQNQTEELEAAGFSVIRHDVYGTPSKPSTYVGWLKLAS